MRMSEIRLESNREYRGQAQIRPVAESPIIYNVCFRTDATGEVRDFTGTAGPFFCTPESVDIVELRDVTASASRPEPQGARPSDQLHSARVEDAR